MKGKTKLPLVLADAIRSAAPETLALVRAINADASTADSYGGYLSALAQCDSQFERTMLAVCMMDCPETKESGLRAAIRILGPYNFIQAKGGVN